MVWEPTRISGKAILTSTHNLHFLEELEEISKLSSDTPFIYFFRGFMKKAVSIKAFAEC